MIPDSKTKEIISNYYRIVDLSEALSNPKYSYILKHHFDNDVDDNYDAVTITSINKNLEDFPQTQENPNINYICMSAVSGQQIFHYPDILYGTNWILMESNVYGMSCNANCKSCIYSKNFPMDWKCGSTKLILCEHILEHSCRECEYHVLCSYQHYCTRPKDFDENKC